MLNVCSCLGDWRAERPDIACRAGSAAPALGRQDMQQSGRPMALGPLFLLSSETLPARSVQIWKQDDPVVMLPLAVLHQRLAAQGMLLLRCANMSIKSKWDQSPSWNKSESG